MQEPIPHAFDKAARKGIARYLRSLELDERTVKFKTYIETIGVLATIILGLLGLLIAG